MAWQNINGETMKATFFFYHFSRQHHLQTWRHISTSNQDYQFQNHYATLGIPHTATVKQAKIAYFDLSKKYHPDRNKASNAHEKFTEINKAYEIIGNDSLRRVYDNEYFLHFPSKFSGQSVEKNPLRGQPTGHYWRTAEDFDRWCAMNKGKIYEYQRQRDEEYIREHEERVKAFIRENRRIMRELFNKVHDLIIDGGKFFAVVVTVTIPCLFTFLFYKGSQKKKNKMAVTGVS